MPSDSELVRCRQCAVAWVVIEVAVVNAGGTIIMGRIVLPTVAAKRLWVECCRQVYTQSQGWIFKRPNIRTLLRLERKYKDEGKEFPIDLHTKPKKIFEPYADAGKAFQRARPERVKKILNELSMMDEKKLKLQKEKQEARKKNWNAKYGDDFYFQKKKEYPGQG